MKIKWGRKKGKGKKRRRGGASGKERYIMYINRKQWLPFCSNLAWLTDIGTLPPGRKGAPSNIWMARATEGSYVDILTIH